MVFETKLDFYETKFVKLSYDPTEQGHLRILVRYRQENLLTKMALLRGNRRDVTKARNQVV